MLKLQSTMGYKTYSYIVHCGITRRISSASEAACSASLRCNSPPARHYCLFSFGSVAYIFPNCSIPVVRGFRFNRSLVTAPRYVLLPLTRPSDRQPGWYPVLSHPIALTRHGWYTFIYLHVPSLPLNRPWRREDRRSFCPLLLLQFYLLLI